MLHYGGSFQNVNVTCQLMHEHVHWTIPYPPEFSSCSNTHADIALAACTGNHVQPYVQLSYIFSCWFQPSKGPHQLKVVQPKHAVHVHRPLARALGQGKERRWKGTSQKQKEKVNEAKVQRQGRKREKIGSERLLLSIAGIAFNLYWGRGSCATQFLCSQVRVPVNAAAASNSQTQQVQAKAGFTKCVFKLPSPNVVSLTRRGAKKAKNPMERTAGFRF